MIAPELLKHQDEFARVSGGLPVVATLDELPADGAMHLWPEGELLARRLDDRRYVAVAPRLFTWALLWGHVDNRHGFVEHWCYPSLFAAVAAAACWDGTGDPVGWVRHPRTGRRRRDGDESREYVEP